MFGKKCFFHNICFPVGTGLNQEKNPAIIRAYLHSIYLGRAEIDMWTRARNVAGGFGGLSSCGTSGEAQPKLPATQATRLGGPIKIWLSSFAHTGIKLDKTMKTLRKFLKDSCKLFWAFSYIFPRHKSTPRLFQFKTTSYKNLSFHRRTNLSWSNAGDGGECSRAL